MNIIRDGVILVVFEFIVILLWVVLSSPMAVIINSLINAGTTMGITQMTTYGILVNRVVDIIFLLMGLCPVIWFFFRVYQREQDWGYRYE
jgi:hypothetical protein